MSEVIVRVDLYLEFSSSSTSIVTIPNRLIYVCISGRFASMQSILEVSHWASYLLQTAMCFIGRNVASTYSSFLESVVSGIYVLAYRRTAGRCEPKKATSIVLAFTSVSLIGPIWRSVWQMLRLWFSADTEISSASRLVLWSKVLLNTENNLLKHLPSPLEKSRMKEGKVRLCTSK